MCTLEFYNSTFRKYYGDLVKFTQIEQIYNDFRKLAGAIIQWYRTAGFSRRTYGDLCVRQVYMECFTHDVFACIRRIRRGRPLFMHFLEHQQLYVSTAIPQNDILQAMQQGSCLRTVRQLQIKEHASDPIQQLNSLLIQHGYRDSDSSVCQIHQTPDAISNNTSVTNQRHLLAVLPNTRHKIPKH